jgi:hypothetical protein
VENVIVIAAVIIALGWGLVSVVRSVRRVKAAGEAPAADDAGFDVKKNASDMTTGCSCSDAGSCPVVEKCSEPMPADTGGPVGKER